MKTLSLYSDSIEGRFISQAVEALRDGQVIIYPTDTLYALGCDALNPKAIQRLCQVKGLNPDKNYLSVVCSSLSQAAEYARIDNHAFKILKDNLPGPFTFILPASTKLPKQFKGRKTVGLRIPDNPIAISLAQELGNPILTSSVDPLDGDAESIASPPLLAEKYENIAALLIDAGQGGLTPSTVIDISDSYNPQIIREGLGHPII